MKRPRRKLQKGAFQPTRKICQEAIQRFLKKGGRITKIETYIDNSFVQYSPSTPLVDLTE